MNTATTEPTIKDFQTRQELFESDLPVYTKAQLLAQWDRQCPPELSAREEILARGLSAYESAKLIEALPPEKPQPVRLSANERAAVAEARNKLEALGKEFVELIAKREQGQQAFEQTSREKKRLESTLDFDDAPGISSLVFTTARVTVTQNWLNSAAAKIRAIETNADSILSGVNQLFNRRFGMSPTPGGRGFANPGMGSLPTRIAGCVASIETALGK